MPLERRAEGPRSKARGATLIQPKRDPNPGPKGPRPLGRRDRGAGRGRSGGTAAGIDRRSPRPSEAKLSTESNARRSDGTSGGRRESAARVGGGQTQPRRGGHRRHDQRTTRTSLRASRREDSSETVGGALDAESRAAGENTQAERGQAAVGHPDGDGSAGAASFARSAAVDLRSVVQRVELRISAGAQCARRGTRGAGVRPRRSGLGGGSRHRPVFRSRSPRHSDAPGRASDSGQEGVAVDRAIPAGGRAGGRGGGRQRGGHAARRAVVSVCWRTSTWTRSIGNSRAGGCAFVAMPTTATFMWAARRRRSGCSRGSGTGSRRSCDCK